MRLGWSGWASSIRFHPIRFPEQKCSDLLAGGQETQMQRAHIDPIQCDLIPFGLICFDTQSHRYDLIRYALIRKRSWARFVTCDGVLVVPSRAFGRWAKCLGQCSKVFDLRLSYFLVFLWISMCAPAHVPEEDRGTRAGGN